MLWFAPVILIFSEYYWLALLVAVILLLVYE